MAKLPILMYHNVIEKSGQSQGLTISKARLESHFKFLKDNNYTTIFLDELSHLKKLPRKTVIITFDDVYVNQLELALPLLKTYNLKATFFVPFQYVSGFDDWNSGIEPIMSLEQLKDLDSNIVELGWHSFAHLNYAQISNDELQKDLKKCKDYIVKHGLNVKPVLAYPYGKFPRKNHEQLRFETTLKENGIEYGLRIGNRVNSFPFKNPYEIQRIDIKGEDTIARFRLKLKLGKLHLF